MKQTNITTGLNAQGRGLLPDGAWSRHHWDPPCANKKERLGRLLVVAIREETNLTGTCLRDAELGSDSVLLSRRGLKRSRGRRGSAGRV
jgi:hypothetical protein